MMSKKNKSTTFILLLCIAGVFIMPYISSCGKSGQTSVVGFNTQLQILNLGPDVQPINFYMGFIKQNSYPYDYPTSSGYFYLKTLDTPLQIRSALTTTANLISIDNPGFKSNHKYTLFVTGVLADSTITSIFTEDDAVSTPKIGYGAVRFVNASVQSPALDITANGTMAFKNVKYLAVSDYIQLPAGNYNFQVSPTGTSAVLTTPNLQGTKIQDGRLYTLYAYGVTTKADSAAFGAGVIINR